MNIARLLIMSGCLFSLNVGAQEPPILTTTLPLNTQNPAGEVNESALNRLNNEGFESPQNSKNNSFIKAHDLIQKFEQNPTNFELAKQAIELLKQSLQQFNKDEGLIRKTAINNLAVLLIRLKDYDEAQKWLLKSLNEEAWVSTTLGNLNQLYAYEAQSAYKEVFEKSVVQTPQGKFMALPTEFNELHQRAELNAD